MSSPRALSLVPPVFPPAVPPPAVSTPAVSIPRPQHLPASLSSSISLKEEGVWQRNSHTPYPSLSRENILPIENTFYQRGGGLAAQVSHTRTSSCQPREGTGSFEREQRPQTNDPHARQWCFDKSFFFWWVARHSHKSVPVHFLHNVTIHT